MLLLKSHAISNIALGSEVNSIVDLGHFVKSQCLQHFTGVTHWVSYQDIQKNYHRNLPKAFDVWLQTSSNSKKGLHGPVVHKFFEVQHIRISNRGDDFQNTIARNSPAV